jgi:maltose alpha-D-glucosyltransferase/alpha-amylase
MRLDAILKENGRNWRIRIHGDLHLGQILFLDESFRMCDFEGLPMVPLSERRIKRSPWRDVASIVNSIFYAGHYALLDQISAQHKHHHALLPHVRSWAMVIARGFFRTYRNSIADTFLGHTADQENARLFGAFLLERGLQDATRAAEEKDFLRLQVAIRCLLDYLAFAPEQILIESDEEKRKEKNP